MMKTMVGEMQTKENTGESEDSELSMDKKSVVDEWFDSLDNDAPEHEPEHIQNHTNKYKFTPEQIGE